MSVQHQQHMTIHYIPRIAEKKIISAKPETSHDHMITEQSTSGNVHRKRGQANAHIRFATRD